MGNYGTRTHCNMRKCGRPRYPNMGANASNPYMTNPSNPYMSTGGRGGYDNAPQRGHEDGYGQNSFGYQYGGMNMPNGGYPPYGGGYDPSMGQRGPQGGGYDPSMGHRGPQQPMKRPRDNREGLNWTCPKCNNQNFASRTKCNMRKCGESRPEATKTWKCVKCGNENYPTREVCNMRKCQQPRPTEEGGATDEVGDGEKRQKLETQNKETETTS